MSLNKVLNKVALTKADISTTNYFLILELSKNAAVAILQYVKLSNKYRLTKYRLTLLLSRCGDVLKMFIFSLWL